MYCNVLHVFTYYMYTMNPSAVFGVCVSRGGGQHYGLEIDIHCNILSSGSLILHCCVVFHLEPVSHLPTGGHWDHVQSFPVTSAGLRRACESSGRSEADRLSPRLLNESFQALSLSLAGDTAFFCQNQWPWGLGDWLRCSRCRLTSRPLKM